MKKAYNMMTVFFLPLFILACQRSTTETSPIENGQPASEQFTSAVTATPADIWLPNEKIMILEPGPGSRVVSPVRISGVADSTFEQTLVVRLLLEDGSEIALQPTMIHAELGQRGPFELDLEFEINGEQPAFIQVFEHSARDGEIIHLSTVGITISSDGPAEIRVSEPKPEQIVVLQPTIRERVSGGSATVRGYGWASFEQTLLIEVQDENGSVVGSTPILVDSPEMGQPGHFTAEVPYQVSQIGPGRILIRDISPAFGGDIHRTSVEIELAP
jgi:hypothetical protein